MIDLDHPVVQEFHQLYYDNPGQTWYNTFWFGTPVQKCPLDLWIYQEIIYETKPDLIVETGTFKGGSAHFMASILDLLGDGEVITIDIEYRPARPVHPRLTYLTGSSTDSQIVSTVYERASGKRLSDGDSGLRPQSTARHGRAAVAVTLGFTRELPDRGRLECKRPPSPSGVWPGTDGGDRGLLRGEQRFRSGPQPGKAAVDLQSQRVPAETGTPERR